MAKAGLYTQPNFWRRVHRRNASSLRQQPKRALELAQHNWLVQKEPADASVLLEAAQAAEDRAGIKSVVDWVIYTSLQDAKLSRLRLQKKMVLTPVHPKNFFAQFYAQTVALFYK